MSTTLNEYIDARDEDYRCDVEIKDGGARIFVYHNPTEDKLEGIKFYLKPEDAEQFACDLLAASRNS